jgi:phage FluMu protein Com
MTGRYTDELMAARRQALDDGLFEWVPNSRRSKIRCVTCTHQSPSQYGFLGGAWMDAHIAGHGTCPDCGVVRPTTTMQMHRSNRWHKRGEQT